MSQIEPNQDRSTASSKNLFILDTVDAQSVDNIFINGVRGRVRLLENHAIPYQTLPYPSGTVDIVSVMNDRASRCYFWIQITHTVDNLEQGRFPNLVNQGSDFIRHKGREHC